jgi:hypothetical protein
VRPALVAVTCAACGRIGFDAARVSLGDDSAAPNIELVGTSQQPLVVPVTSTVIVTPPTNVVAGDVLLLAFYGNLTTAALTPPPEWQVRFDGLDTTSQFRATYLLRVAAGPESAGYSFTATGTNDIAWGMIAYRGVSAAKPVDDEQLAIAAASITPATITYIAPSLAAAHAGDQLVLLVINDAGYGGTWSAPGDMTDRNDSFRVAIFDRAVAADGATGSEAATMDLSNQVTPRGAVWLVALAP